MDFLFFGLLFLAVLFGPPLAAWGYARRTRARVEELSLAVARQETTIDLLATQVGQLRTQIRDASASAAVPAATAGQVPAAVPAATAGQVPAAAPAATAGQVPAAIPAVKAPAPPSAPVPAAPPVKAPVTPPSTVSVPPARPSILPPAPRVVTPPPPAAPSATPKPPAAAAAVPAASASQGPAAVPTASASQTVPPAPPRIPPLLPRPPVPPAPPFDWESLIGVKLFSAIAGIALVIAAIFFLRYSVEHGWLQPPVRVVIGIVVGIALLVVCELRAARRYPVTANALDAAAIAILFATFFAAHALWNLIPSLAAFVLLAMVTATAVLLSIRRESLFIAVLGLLGGFATPALLSTGENRPIPLFAYLMLLNVGLAWVAHRKRWPLLTALTLVFTTLYQWGWVFKFLDASSLTLAMSIFVIFPVITVAGVVIAQRRVIGHPSGTPDKTFEYTALLATALPLLFAVYVSAVPAFGARPWLLFGFMLLLDGGLFAIATMRREPLLYAAAAITTVIVMASWLAFSFTPGTWLPPLLFCAVFVTFFICAPLLAARAGRRFEAKGAEFAAPLLLFVPVVLARLEPAFSAPLPLFATLLGLVLLIAWRSIASGTGVLYYLAAFFAVAAQASWSATHLRLELLPAAVAVYAVFGIVSAAVPVFARRIGRPLQPREGSGVVLIASLALLLFLSLGSLAPAALWALALLLAIINAGLFIESGASGLPRLSLIGSAGSWIVLASWWYRAGAAVGVLPSLAVLTGLTLITLAGHGWVSRTLRPASGSTDQNAHARSADGLYLGLTGHLFLLFVAVNPEWSIPPWPLFGTLAVLTLAVSAASLASRRPALHTAGTVAAGVIVAAWAYATTGSLWAFVALLASAVTCAFALGWIVIARDGAAAAAAGATLFLAELTAIISVAGGDAPPFRAVVAAHVVNLSLLLALTWVRRWQQLALWTVVPAALALVVQWQDGDPAAGWLRLLVLAVAVYLVFTAYPVVLGRRAENERDPYLAAVLASGVFFFAAREALIAGDYGHVIGVLPVVQGTIMALLLRQLLRMQPTGHRDLGRLALVGGAALAFVTVAIPLQLERQWITIGWALEGAALAWLFVRVPHRGLLNAGIALLGAAFVRLAMNPEILHYEPRGALRIFNWYLYAYVICAAAFLFAAWQLSRSEEQIAGTGLRPVQVLPAGAVILLFILLNIEIADFYATGPTIMFRFGVTVSQDLTYTIGWLAFGMLLLAACIYLHNRFGRVAALALIALTTFKCFLYDLGSLEGLYRVGSFVGLALSLAVVSLALQKFVLTRPEEQA